MSTKLAAGPFKVLGSNLTPSGRERQGAVIFQAAKVPSSFRVSSNRQKVE